MNDVKKKYWWNVGERRFAIRPISAGGYVLSIDGQLGGFFSEAADAAMDCRCGHVSTVISASAPYLVLTKTLDFPSELGGWNEGEEVPLEVGQ